MTAEATEGLHLEQLEPVHGRDIPPDVRRQFRDVFLRLTRPGPLAGWVDRIGAYVERAGVPLSRYNWVQSPQNLVSDIILDVANYGRLYQLAEALWHDAAMSPVGEPLPHCLISPAEAAVVSYAVHLHVQRLDQVGSAQAASELDRCAERLDRVFLDALKKNRSTKVSITPPEDAARTPSHDDMPVEREA